MEIEKKYLLKELPEDLQKYPHVSIEQGYLCQTPAIRIRKWGDDYILTYKNRAVEHDCAGNAVCVNQETELPLTREAFVHLREKTDGVIIQKTRYMIPFDGKTIELDVFDGDYKGLQLAEVEFDSVEEAECFQKPDWFGKNVSEDVRYTNAWLSSHAEVGHTG